ncbi:hypothetical protein E2C01_026173 [Portunus trituberculatus]|uniref:Uncharacterized protein n=1 Tax=Portunus trituberculatus TaxID=210409 RepID=A0A5B7EIF7_PORTR|nr:hypothetical protein [Portunus trituberculatus]
MYKLTTFFKLLGLKAPNKYSSPGHNGAAFFKVAQHLLLITINSLIQKILQQQLTWIKPCKNLQPGVFLHKVGLQDYKTARGITHGCGASTLNKARQYCGVVWCVAAGWAPPPPSSQPHNTEEKSRRHYLSTLVSTTYHGLLPIIRLKFNLTLITAQCSSALPPTPPPPPQPLTSCTLHHHTGPIRLPKGIGGPSHINTSLSQPAPHHANTTFPFRLRQLRRNPPAWPAPANSPPPPPPLTPALPPHLHSGYSGAPRGWLARAPPGKRAGVQCAALAAPAARPGPGDWHAAARGKARQGGVRAARMAIKAHVSPKTKTLRNSRPHLSPQLSHPPKARTTACPCPAGAH